MCFTSQFVTVMVKNQVIVGFYVSIQGKNIESARSIGCAESYNLSSAVSHGRLPR